MPNTSSSPVAPALSPAELEDAVAPLVEAHRRRVQAIGQLAKTEREVKARLLHALRPRELSIGWFGALSVRLGLREPDPAPNLAERHMAAVKAVRDFGYQLDAVEREAAVLDAEISSVAAAAAQAAERAAVLRDLGSDQERDASRYEAEARRREALCTEQRELRALLEELEEGLREVHRSAEDAVDELGRHLMVEVREAATSGLARSKETRTALRALRNTVREVSGLVDERSANLDSGAEALARRLRLLDEDAAMRREAAEEVELALANAEGRRAR